MSPEAPANTPTQTSEIVPPDHEATAEAVDMAGDRAVESSVTKIPVAEDPIKSETVGRAAMEANPDTFDGSKAARLHELMTKPTDEQITRHDEDTRTYAGFVNDAERLADEAAHSGDTVYAEGYRSVRDTNQALYENELVAGRERVKDRFKYQYEQNIPRGKQERQAALEPFEEFYDLSPDVFSKMPTAEFVAAYKEFSEIERVIKYSSEGLEHTSSIVDKLKEMIDGKRRIAFSPQGTRYPYFGGDVYSREIISTVAVGIGAFDADKYDIKQAYLREDKRLDGLYDFNETFDPGAKNFEGFEDFNAIVSKYIEIHNDDFNKSPHQIMEDYVRLTTEYEDQIKARLDQAEQRKKEFMAKYTNETPDGGGEQVAETPEQAPESPEQNQPQTS